MELPVIRLFYSKQLSSFKKLNFLLMYNRSQCWQCQMQSRVAQLYMDPFSLRLLSHPGRRITLCRVPCVLQWILVDHPFQIQQCVHVDVKLPHCPFLPAFLKIKAERLQKIAVSLSSSDLLTYVSWAPFSFYNSPSFLGVKVNEQGERKVSQYYGQNDPMCYQPHTYRQLESVGRGHF